MIARVTVLVLSHAGVKYRKLSVCRVNKNKIDKNAVEPRASAPKLNLKWKAVWQLDPPHG